MLASFLTERYSRAKKEVYYTMAEVVVPVEEQSDDLKGGIKATRPIDREAEKLQKRVTLPKVPSRTITDAQWLEYARLLTPEMWPQISTMYLYRLKPKIIRQQSDPTNKNYIDKPDRIADLRTYTIKNHSWGKYRCEINRFLTSGGGEQKLVDVIIEITEEESPEFYLDVKELDKNDSSNMGLLNRLRAKGIIDDKGNVAETPRSIQQASSSIAQQDLMSMFDKMMNLVTRMNTEQKEELKARLAASGEAGLSGQIGNILLEKMKQDNPGNMATIISSTLSMAKEIMGPRQEKDDSKTFELFKQMLEMQQKHSEQLITVLKEAKEQPGEKIVDSVETAISLVERLSAITGGGGRRSGWDTGLEYAKELGLPLFNAISQIYTVYKMGKPMDSTIQQQGQPAKPSGKTISGMEAAANAARIAAGQKPAMYTGEPNNTPNPPTEVTPEIVNEEHQQLMALLQPAAGPILKFMADGRSGAELALAIIDMYGAPSHLMLANFGEDKILAAVKGIPQFWSNLEVYGEERVKQFLTEFIHYEDFVEEEPPDEPETRQKKTKK